MKRLFSLCVCLEVLEQQAAREVATTTLQVEVEKLTVHFKDERINDETYNEELRKIVAKKPEQEQYLRVLAENLLAKSILD